jgi:transposase-like protein
VSDNRRTSALPPICPVCHQPKWQKHLETCPGMRYLCPECKRDVTPHVERAAAGPPPAREVVVSCPWCERRAFYDA